ncbi:hypothetical protein LZK98_08180 [Sphingomonas cannabina]|uniref:hypothetical protein n=1 Tax=Sphingomonas cannabina TaxID=2899123 RepID=UPI001F23D537|nr:hypothetical protein [Sphingomonas cannabina]UIJ46906.1 hypothetical protein LZK98_08180 [Sphingomonas cannabina]
MTSAFSGWAILELMGHRQRPGFVEEVEIAGGKMLRVDIHGADGEVVTELYGVASVYSLRPVSEDIARHAARHVTLRPLRPVEYRDRPQLTGPAGEDDLDDDDQDEMPF